MAALHIYSVTLAFTPPGPLHTSLLIAQDEASAAARAMQSACTDLAIETPVAGVVVVAVDADVLRRMLVAVEGRGPGEVVSLVPREQRAAEILRQHPQGLRDGMTIVDPSGKLDGHVIGGLDAADAATFTGDAASPLWALQPPYRWHPPLVRSEPYTDPEWPHTPREPAA